MSFRNALLATTVLVFPVAVEAQMPAEPVTGIYLGAAGGFNIKTNPNINGSRELIFPGPQVVRRPMRIYRRGLEEQPLAP